MSHPRTEPFGEGVPFGDVSPCPLHTTP